MTNLDKKIVIAISGGIAAYKVPDVVRALATKGADVHVVMSEAAQHFVTPYLLEKLSGNPVLTQVFQGGSDIPHTEIVKDADLICVVPATAQTIARLVHGFAERPIELVCLAGDCPKMLLPSMNTTMYQSESVQSHLTSLRRLGCEIIDPEEGMLACGTYGHGRLAHVEQIVDTIVQRLTDVSLQKYKHKKVLITAGATREYLDDIRYITNTATGTLGELLATELQRIGAQVHLIHAHDEKLSAADLFAAVKKHFDDTDIMISTAAVCDVTFSRFSGKLKKTANLHDAFTQAKPTVDILAWCGQHKKNQLLVGFALEDTLNTDAALKKIQDKNLDAIVLNRTQECGTGMILPHILDAKGSVLYEIDRPIAKKQAARTILDTVHGLL